MSIFREIAKQSGLTFVTRYTVVNYGGCAVYVEGITRLLYVSGEVLRAAAGKAQLEISGAELTIEQLETGAMIVKGRITSVTESGNG